MYRCELEEWRNANRVGTDDRSTSDRPGHGKTLGEGCAHLVAEPEIARERHGQAEER